MEIKIDKKPAHIWTNEHRQFLRDNIEGKTKNELLILFNKTFKTSLILSQIIGVVKNMKLKSGVITRFQKGGGSYPRRVSYQRRCTKQEIDWLRENCELPNYLITELFNQTFGLNYTQRRLEGVKTKHGIRNPNHGLQRFVSGYKKGQVPFTWVPVGTERTTSVGGYTEVKVRDGEGLNNWEFKHRMVWESANGPIPKGHIVIFADGDIKNCELSNLRLILRGQNGVINSQIKRTNSAEITDTSILYAKVKMSIKKREKNKESGNSENI